MANEFKEFKQPQADWRFWLQWLLCMMGLWWLIEWGITTLNRHESDGIWARKDRTEYYKVRFLCAMAFAALVFTLVGLVLWAFFPGLWRMATIAGVVYVLLTGVYYLDAAFRYKRETAPPAPTTTT